MAEVGWFSSSTARLLNILCILPKGRAGGMGGREDSRAVTEERERKVCGDLIGHSSIGRKGLKLLPLSL